MTRKATTDTQQEPDDGAGAAAGAEATAGEKLEELADLLKKSGAIAGCEGEKVGEGVGAAGTKMGEHATSVFANPTASELDGRGE